MRLSSFYFALSVLLCPLAAPRPPPLFLRVTVSRITPMIEVHRGDSADSDAIASCSGKR